MSPALVAALLLGLRHGAEPAHLAAVAALVGLGTSPRRSLAAVLAYALAHGIVIALLAGLAIAIGTVAGDEALALLERAGGATLMLFGLLALRAVLSGRHEHPVSGLAARLGARGIAGAALFGALHAAGGEVAGQALATAGLTRSSELLLAPLLFIIGLVAANLVIGLLLIRGMELHLPHTLHRALLAGYGLVGLIVGASILLG